MARSQQKPIENIVGKRTFRLITFRSVRLGDSNQTVSFSATNRTIYTSKCRENCHNFYMGVHKGLISAIGLASLWAQFTFKLQMA